MIGFKSVSEKTKNIYLSFKSHAYLTFLIVHASHQHISMDAKTIVRVLNNKDFKQKGRLATGMTCQLTNSIYMNVCVISVRQMSNSEKLFRQAHRVTAVSLENNKKHYAKTVQCWSQLTTICGYWFHSDATLIFLLFIYLFIHFYLWQQCTDWAWWKQASPSPPSYWNGPWPRLSSTCGYKSNAQIINYTWDIMRQMLLFV